MLYYATTNMRKLSTRQAYLLKFFEFVRGSSRPEKTRSAILTSCPFSQADITLVVEAIQTKISDVLAMSREATAFTEKWRVEVCSLI